MLNLCAHHASSPPLLPTTPHPLRPLTTPYHHSPSPLHSTFTPPPLHIHPTTNHSPSPHHSSPLTQPPHTSSLPLFKGTKSEYSIREKSLSHVYKLLQDLPITQNIISDTRNVFDSFFRVFLCFKIGFAAIFHMYLGTIIATNKNQVQRCFCFPGIFLSDTRRIHGYTHGQNDTH